MRTPSFAALGFLFLCSTCAGNGISESCPDELDHDDIGGLSLLQTAASKRRSVQQTTISVSTVETLNSSSTAQSKRSAQNGTASSRSTANTTAQLIVLAIEGTKAYLHQNGTDVPGFKQFQGLNGEWCTWAKTLSCFLWATLVVLFALATVQNVVAGEDQADKIRTKLVTTQFVMQLGFSIVILDSYGLSVALGRDAAFSGFIVGAYALAQGLGCVFVWALMKWNPGLWRRSGWKIVGTGVSLSLVGMCMYLVVAMCLESPKSKWWFGDTETSSLSSLVIWARIMGGFGLGVMQQIGVTTVARVTPESERTTQILTFMLASMCANAIGPLLSVFAQSFNSSFTAAPWLIITIYCGVLLWLPWDLPSLETVDDVISLDDDEAQDLQVQYPFAQRTIIAGCLGMGLLGSYASGALEVGSALLLQEHFHWSTWQIGVFVSVALMSSILVYFMLDMNKSWVSVSSFVRIMYTISMFGAFILLTSQFAGGWMLLISDALVNSTVFMAEALILTIMMQNLMPKGYFFADAATAVMWTQLLNNGVGRLAGPWLARYLIQTGGVMTYGCSQIAVLCVFVLVFEIYVNPNNEDVARSIRAMNARKADEWWDKEDKKKLQPADPFRRRLQPADQKRALRLQPADQKRALDHRFRYCL